MPRKWNDKGMGRAIQNDRRRHAESLRQQGLSRLEEWNNMQGRSVLEQSSLDDLIATVELRKEEYAAEVGTAELVSGPSLVSKAPARAAEVKAAHRRELLSIPRRPAWRDGMDMDELAKLEADSFTEWRRGLALAAQEEGLHLTPYERNLDFWRQLWRCMERSDLLVQIVDARDPDFYYCRDLLRYQKQLGGDKRMMLLVNKADFLTPEIRQQWADHFAANGVDAVFFSGLREVRKQQPAHKPPHTVPEEGEEEAEAEEEEDEEDVEDEPRRPVPSVFCKAQGAEDEEAPEPAAAAAKGPGASPSKPAKAEDVPVPGLDFSDEELGDGAGQDDGEAPEASWAPLGALADDDDGVADADRLLEELVARLPDPEEDARPAASNASTCVGRRGTVGFVGYPNVGKSTVINALVGAKRVGMSRTPGKTKHIQTLELQDLGVTLCDCPGLVFPSVAATRAHLVVNNTVHIDDLIDVFEPIALIVEKIGLEQILEHYAAAHAVADAAKRSGDHQLDAAHSFLAALAVSRNHFLRVGVPDENWAARKVLKDYVSGELLHCELPVPPEGTAAAAAAPEPIVEPPAPAPAAEAEQTGAEDQTSVADDEFADVDAFLKSHRKERGMTKRRARAMQKQMLRGATPQELSGEHGAVGAWSRGTFQVPVA